MNYVGAPHPIDFGDNYQCHLLRISDKGELLNEYMLHPPRKLIIDAATPNDIRKYKLNPGDQYASALLSDRARAQQHGRLNHQACLTGPNNIRSSLTRLTSRSMKKTWSARTFLLIRLVHWKRTSKRKSWTSALLTLDGRY